MIFSLERVGFLSRGFFSVLGELSCFSFVS